MPVTSFLSSQIVVNNHKWIDPLPRPAGPLRPRPAGKGVVKCMHVRCSRAALQILIVTLNAHRDAHFIVNPSFSAHGQPKIKQKYFPNISPEAYWTSKPNFWNRKMYWTVNFMTGHNYSRFFAYQQLPVLFVKDR